MITSSCLDKQESRFLAKLMPLEVTQKSWEAAGWLLKPIYDFVYSSEVSYLEMEVLTRCRNRVTSDKPAPWNFRSGTGR